MNAKKGRNRLLSLLLCCIMLVALFPTRAHAWEEVVECEFCGKICGDDYICSGGDHCSESSGRSCYEEHHCKSCGECENNADEWCEDCHMCVECAIDEECHCAECGSCFVDYPPCPGGCGRCGECVDEWCDSCGMCVECAIEKGDHCPDCGACTTEEGCLICHRCFDCGGQCGDGCTDACLTCHLENEKACEECGACFVNDDSKMCIICHTCADCAGDFCDDCHMCIHCAVDNGMHCPNCAACYDKESNPCLGDCDRCSECADDWCEDCQMCVECAIEAGNHCPDCGACTTEEGCLICHRCGECAELCIICGDYCHDCVPTCESCGTCKNCATICDNCGSVCTECGTICPDCGLCEECCAGNSRNAGCNHDICIKSGEWEAHWSEQHAGQEHTHIYDYSYDANGHWYACCVGSCSERTDSEGHSFSGWSIIKPSTCKENGIRVRKCMVCGYRVTETITNGNHIISDWESDETHHWKECTVVGCGVVIDGTKAAHTASDWITDTAATATTNGTKHKECTACHRVLETSAIPATGSEHTHSYGTAWKFDDTQHWHECSCGDKADIAAHIKSDYWITDTAATATTNGTKHKECTACHRVLETSAIPATGSEHTHSYGTAWKFDDTQHWHECSCGDKADIAAHIKSDYWITDTAATATTNGTKHKECTACHRVLETSTIPATGSEHTHSYGTAWKSDDAQHWHECSCGDKTDIAAHTESDWIIDTPATATGYGTKHKECTVCVHRIQEARIEPTGSGTITIIVPSTEEPTKPADQKNPSTGAAPGSIGYDTVMGLAAAGVLCFATIKLAKKDEE